MINTAKVDSMNAAMGASATSSAQSGLNNTFSDFILLLTTQLKNQDPTQPLDTNQITQQIASMTQVQEQLNTNKYLQQLIGLSGGSQLDSAVNYIGRVIEAEGNQAQMLTNGEEQGAVFLYDLPSEAMSATIVISDSTGKVVYNGNALKNEGRNEVVWDGSNNLNGQIMPPGSYEFKILAKDFNGNDMEVKTFTTGIVTSADSYNGEVTLSLGGIKVNIDDVLAIKTAQELL